MGLVGPNGAGKTTIIKSIINAINIDSGFVNVFGLDVKKNEIKIKEHLGYVSDSIYFMDDLTAKDVGFMMSKIYSSWNKRDFEKHLYEFAMPLTQPIKNYSAGMKTKLMLASVFSRNTKLLILDEPTSGLDPVMRDEFLMLIKDYIRNGERSVLYSTHITTDLEKTADFISFINNGKMILSENIDTLKESYYMVKDGLETLKDVTDLCIGYRKYDYGFEALITQKNLGKMPSTSISQPASIDDIVVFHSLKREKM